ncbi:HEAT repeat domain-containing protein [bacterium]|nr:HEAT repeat domain-containing protein [bacterium]
MTGTDAARRAVAHRGLIGAASAHLTETLAMRLPFEALGPFKNSLKRFFSDAQWTAADAQELSKLVASHVDDGQWEFLLDDDLTLTHGIIDGMYLIAVEGTVADTRSMWDRAFSGPVVPEQTPHPRKVKFGIGGQPAPGIWYRRGEDISEPAVTALMEDDDVEDVMVAGDFVTIGLRRTASWEDRLDEMVDRVTELWWSPERSAAGTTDRTRDELLQEGRALTVDARPEDLHLLDPDRPDHREALVAALGADDPRSRRAAVATLSLSDDSAVVKAALVTGYRDSSRLVRRTAIDAASDLEQEEFRPLFEEALDDEDAWTRWKAVRSLRDLGAGPSQEQLIFAAVDEDFRVRFEAEAALRGD